MRAATAIALLVAGCDSLAGNEYVGEPMFTLVGTFATTGRAPATPFGGVALLWQDAVGAGGPGIAATTVPVAIAFPDAFRVDVPTPPPAAARFGFADADVELAEAYVYVVADAGAARVRPRGADRAHALVFASADVAAGTLAADYLGGPMAAGYHLRRYASATTPGSAQAALVERCAAVAPRDACVIRRAYQLAPIGDDDPLRIEVTPP
jgi:hypothetical protein